MLGPKGFSEFYYLGSEPLDGVGEMVDVLFCERYGARSHWYFSRDKGILVGFDTFRDEEVDPCEIRFEGITALETRRLPAHWTIRSGDHLFGQWKITGASFAPAAAPSPTSNGERK